MLTSNRWKNLYVEPCGCGRLSDMLLSLADASGWDAVTNVSMSLADASGWDAFAVEEGAQ